MERIFEFIIDETSVSKTIRDFLKTHGFSSQNIIALKKMPESILVNEKWEYVSYCLKKNDRLTIHLQEQAGSEKILPVSLPLEIIFEDEDILILNKPSGMPIHPSQNNYDNTLANAVAYYYESKNIPFIFRCTNRLDRDTTGLTVLAKNMVSANLLSEMVRNRTMHREYLAIVDGIIPDSQGTVTAPIARAADSTIERCVNFEHGESAITHYQKLETSENNTLLLLALDTGRTHQIRVHMKYLGHPLIGDFLYNPDTRRISRQALHSYRISFLHPITGTALSFTAPLPSDMREAMNISSDKYL